MIDAFDSRGRIGAVRIRVLVVLGIYREDRRGEERRGARLSARVDASGRGRPGGIETGIARLPIIGVAYSSAAAEREI